MKKSAIIIFICFYFFLYSNSLFASPDNWTRKADFGGIERYGAVGFSIGNKGYIGTGVHIYIYKDYYSISFLLYYCNDFWEYDPAADTWTQKANFGGGERSNAVGFSIGSKGYIGTGYKDSSLYKGLTKDFWEYNPVANTWTQKADYGGTTKDAAVGFAIGNKGYLGTGEESPSSFYTKDFWEYDPVTDTWTRKADFGGIARRQAVGFSIGSKGYIGTGDENSSTHYTKDFWEYDPATDIWTRRADFAGVARDDAVGFSIGSKGYLGMGFGPLTPPYKNDFWEYDPVTDTWTQRADFGGTVDGKAVGFSIGNKGYLGTVDSNTEEFWEYEPFDTMPDQFTFTDQTNISKNTLITSNTITVSGINAAVPITIIGGSYSVNSGSYTDAGGTVNNGDTVTVQLYSSENYSTTTNAILKIGDISDTFSVTTEVEPSSDGSRCFIATAAFGSPLAGQVEILRQLRDKYLMTNYFGRKFVAWYYHNGPVAAHYIKDKPLLRAAVRLLLYPLIVFSLLLISGRMPVVIICFLCAFFIFRLRIMKFSEGQQ